MFPKPVRKKRRKRHRISIIQSKEFHYCFLCAVLHEDYRWQQTEEHHVYPGPCRDISEAEGFKVYLCLDHHRTGKDAVHNNAGMMGLLKVIVQREYEKTHTRKEFMELVGRNHIWQERDGFRVGQKVHYKEFNVAEPEKNREGEAYIYSFNESGNEPTMWLSEEPGGRPCIYVWQKYVTPIEG